MTVVKATDAQGSQRGPVSDGAQLPSEGSVV